MQYFTKKFSDAHSRLILFLTLTLILNFFYSGFLIVVGSVNNSKWFIVSAVYYLLLFVIRLYLLIKLTNPITRKQQIMTMQFSGEFLLLINLAIATLMQFIIFSDNQVYYHEIVVITIATFTFLSLTLAIMGSVKFLKQNAYLCLSVKLISLTSASVSLVTLTNTMLLTFGNDNLLLRNIILPLLCIAVSLFIILLAITIIKKSNLALEELKNEEKSK